MNNRQLIHKQLIAILENILPNHYTHTTLDNLFLRIDAPENDKYFVTNKQNKVSGCSLYN